MHVSSPRVVDSLLGTILVEVVVNMNRRIQSLDASSVVVGVVHVVPVVAIVAIVVALEVPW